MSALRERPMMTFEQARSAGRRAYWVGAHEEYMLDPVTGAVYWHPWAYGPLHAAHTREWERLPRGKEPPRTGWIHRLSPPCDCDLCSAA